MTPKPTLVAAALLLSASVTRAQEQTPPPAAPAPPPSSLAPEAPPAPEGTPAPAAGEAPPAPAEPPAAPPPATDGRERARSLYAAAMTDYAAGNFGAAIEKLDGAFSAYDAPTILFARAMTLDRLGRRDEAKAAYVVYLRRRPDDPEAPAIRARVAELSGEPAGGGTGSTGVATYDLPPAPPPEPDRVNEPRRRDGALFLLLGAELAMLSATPSIDDYGAKMSGTGTLIGFAASVGYMPIPGLAIAIGGGVGYQTLELKAEKQAEICDEFGSCFDGSHEPEDESGPAASVRLEVHGFPLTRAPLHLMASAGVAAFGGDDVDGFLGPTAGAGVGAAFFVSDQSSLDVLLRGDLMLETDDHNGAWMIGVTTGWLSQ